MPHLDRPTTAPVHTLFTDRWSPRAFDESVMPDADLHSLFEAARWAPSAFNAQPWRFFYAKREHANWQQFVEFLVSANADWAHRASALVIVASQTDSARSDGSRSPNVTHAFDAGAAWMSLALQATHMGYETHGMGGIHHDKIKEELGLPDNIALHCGVAIGKLAPASVLPEKLQQREAPSPRHDLDTMIAAGGFDLLK